MSTNVRNGLGQFSIDEPNTMIEGELSAGLDHDVRSAINPLESQTWEVDVGDGDGDGDGDFDIDITGGRVALNISYIDSDNNDTAAQVATALAAAWDPANDVAGLVKSVTNPSAGKVAIALNPNPLDITVAASGSDLGVFTFAATETTAGAAIPFGRFVRLADGSASIGIGAQECGLPGASSVAADVLGVAIRERTGIARGESSSSSAVDQYAMGDAVAYCRKGIVAMRVQGASSATAGGQVYFGKPAAGVAGGAYSTNEGGDAVSLTGCRFLTSAAAGELAYVEINLPQ